MSPGRYGSSVIEIVISHMLRIKFMNSSCEIAEATEKLNIGSGNGLIFETTLTQICVTM